VIAIRFYILKANAFPLGSLADDLRKSWCNNNLTDDSTSVLR